MSQHGYMRHTATPPLVLDLIRLMQLAGTAVECLLLHYCQGFRMLSSVFHKKTGPLLFHYVLVHMIIFQSFRYNNISQE